MMAECDTSATGMKSWVRRSSAQSVPHPPPQYIYLVWRSMQKLVTNIDENVS